MYSLLFLCLANLSLIAQEIDTKHIILNLNFSFAKKNAYGTAEITFSPIKESSQVLLDAGFLNIQKITLLNRELQFEYKGDDAAKNLSIKLDRMYKPTEIVKIKIEYSTNYENKSDPNAIGGSFGRGLRFFQPTSATPAKRKQIWSSGEPESNKYWFPCNEDIGDIHSSEIFATVEKPLMVFSNGRCLATKINPNGSQTFHHKSETEFPNYLVSIVIGEYTSISQLSEKIPINTYGYPDEKDAIKATVELLPEMMKFLKTKTGYSYPFEVYNQVVIQDYPFPGLVGQNTLTLLSDNYIDDYSVHKDFKYLWDGVAMQALANQWFGNLIMPKKWEDIWLNNAFAQYFAGLFTTKDNGPAEYLLWYYPFEKSAVLGDWEAGNKHPIVPQKVSDIASFTSDNYSKFRGAIVLRMLQLEMGNELWWKSIQYFVKTHAHKQVTTKDFQHSVETISGKSYQWFFDQWVYKVGLPKFEFSQNYNVAKKELLLSVKQIQKKESNMDYPQIEFFEGKINIEIDGQIETVYLKPQFENVFRYKYNTIPDFINFNYEQTFLAEAIFNKNPIEYLEQLQKSKDLLAKQEAGNRLISMANDSTIDTSFKEKIREVLTKEILSKQYWRYRMWALNALSKLITVPYDEEMILLLKKLIRTESSWLKSSAISILGNTKNPDYIWIYIDALDDKSDRVINSAAIAIGKTKSPVAYELLMGLEKQTSWKNQHRISALNGLQQLGDDRSVNYTLSCIKDNLSPRWYLATPTWDYPFAAVNTLVSLGKGDLAYPILFDRFKKSLHEEDINDIFQQVQLINLLKDNRASEIYKMLKEKFNGNQKMLEAVKSYEEQYLESIKQR